MKKLYGLLFMPKRRTLACLLLTVASLLCFLPMSAMAGTKDSTTINLTDPIVMSGTQLRPGDYTVRWIGTGSDVQVKFLQDNKEVVTVSAKVVNQHNDRVPVLVTGTTNSGSTTIKEIGLSKITLQFSE